MKTVIQNKMSRTNTSRLGILILLSLVLGALDTARAQGGYDPTVQTPTLLYDEARTVYLGNLARRDNGIPPLRWNRQLTHAARWYSWDSTENRPAGFCGHQDTQGHWPDYRAAAFGYLGFAGAENAYCGYLSPEDAIQGWMNSPGHRANLLDPNSREIGLGYYRRNSDGRGYVTQDFGNDAIYPPVIIENEAISTINPNVNLYIYDRSPGGGFAGLGTATQMMVSNNPHFSGASWEAYNTNKAWTLDNGNGWREVYVKTRDKFNRSLTVSDSIYVGANVPLNELGAAQMSTTQSQVTLYNLNGGTLPEAQFSLGWLADDTFGTFNKFWGNGEHINDAAAWGGTAYRLYPGDGESFAWVYDTTFIKDTPLVAYFRLNVNDNTSSSEVARVSVEGGGTEYGPLSLQGTDFTAPNQYQEFALNFTFNTNPNDPFLTFQFWRSGNADVYVDAVSIFSAPRPITSPLTWSVPGHNYRGQGVWVRYTNGSQFSAISEAATIQPPSFAISGNAGVGGATLSYNDGTLKTVNSSANGNYSLLVSNDWSGTVTPSHTCFAFNPTDRSYSNIITNQSAQNYTPTLIPASGCADIDVSIGGSKVGNYGIPPEKSIFDRYRVNGGPVRVSSMNGLPIFTSQRAIYGSSFNSIVGFPANQLTTDYWFTSYDDLGMITYLVIGNPHPSNTAQVDVYIGGNKMNPTSYSIAPGQRIFPRYGINAGPVHVVSTNGVNIFSSERTKFGNSFNEVMGYPGNQLTTDYWFTSYDDVGMITYLVIGNPHPTLNAEVDVYIAGVKKNPTPYSIAPGQRIFPRYTINAGPVHVVSTNGVNIFSSKRTKFGNTFNEVMGYPSNQLTTDYWFTSYDDLGMITYLVIGNPHPSLTAEVDVYIAGEKKNNMPYSIAPGQRVFPRYGINSGPIHVVSTNGVAVFTSERARYLGSFNEILGIANDRLATDYWFTSYDDLGMTTFLVIGAP